MRNLGKIIFYLAANVMFALPLFAQFQDDEIVDDKEQVVVQQNNFFIQPEAFEQWMYGQYGTSSDVEGRFQSQLDVILADVQRVCEAANAPLSEIQLKKLRLAARGDIERFLERVEKARKKFDEVRFDQNRINEVFQEIQPLQAKLQAGLFGEESLFEKTMNKTLTQQQNEPRMQLETERRKFRYQAQIGITLAILENGLPLLDEQREKITKLLEDESQPPKRFSQYDYYYVLLQMAKLPEDKLKGILDETQLKMLQPYLMQARGMEQFLKQQEQQMEAEGGVQGGVF